jgi:hypothetical protein
MTLSIGTFINFFPLGNPVPNTVVLGGLILVLQGNLLVFGTGLYVYDSPPGLSCFDSPLIASQISEVVGMSLGGTLAFVGGILLVRQQHGAASRLMPS